MMLCRIVVLGRPESTVVRFGAFIIIQEFHRQGLRFLPWSVKLLSNRSEKYGGSKLTQVMSAATLKRWRNAATALGWTVTGMMEAAEGFIYP
jgi:hypothetical protein